jgi:hypothetical protein
MSTKLALAALVAVLSLAVATPRRYEIPQSDSPQVCVAAISSSFACCLLLA